MKCVLCGQFRGNSKAKCWNELQQCGLCSKTSVVLKRGGRIPKLNNSTE